MHCSIDTSGSSDGVGSQICAGDDPLVRFERRAIGDGVFAAERAAAAHVLVVLEIELAALRRRRRARAAPAAARGAAPPLVQVRGDRRLDRLHLIALDVEQEHVRRVRRRCCTANCATRFSCSDRTPMMKKLPRPTASRTMRIWLPGRLSCSTACRSANDSRARQRRDRPDQQRAGEVQHDRRAGKARGHERADAQRAGLPDREADQAGDDRHA